jgi:site-specific DNA recombinase
MKAIILARVSTEEQKEAGNSLPAQVERLKNYCRNKGFEISETFSFDESAYKTKRDNFDKILEMIKQSKEKVIVCFDKVDRFSRNPFDKRVSTLYELSMKDKIELHFASDNIIINSEISATQKFQFNMSLGLAKYYSDAIRDSVKRAYEAKIKKGEWLAKAPIGYINIKDEKGNKDLIIDTSKSHFIVKIFKMHSTGNYSLSQITKEMKELGLRGNNKTSKPLSKSMIHHILKNPFYYGEMIIKEKIYPHKYEHLISRETFNKCQEVFTGYHKKPFKYASKPFILRGMIKCSDCGCTISPETAKGHIYYSCTNSKKLHDKRAYIREEDLLKPVYEVLEKIQLPDDKIQKITEYLKETNEAKNLFQEKALRSLRKEYDLIEKMINKLFDLNLKNDESITNDMFSKKLKELKEKQIDIEERMKRHTEADEKFYLTANKVLSLSKRAYEVFESSEVEEKQQLLNFLLQNLKLKDKKLSFELKTPFDTVLQMNECSEMFPR